MQCCSSQTHSLAAGATSSVALVHKRFCLCSTRAFSNAAAATNTAVAECVHWNRWWPPRAVVCCCCCCCCCCCWARRQTNVAARPCMRGCVKTNTVVTAVAQTEGAAVACVCSHMHHTCVCCNTCITHASLHRAFDRSPHHARDSKGNLSPLSGITHASRCSTV